MILSASRMKRWMACPLQQKLRDEYEVEERQHAKTSFGTVIHDALEFYNNSDGNLEEAQDRFVAHWHDPSLLNLPPIDSWTFGRGLNYGSLEGRGLQILAEYDEKQRWEDRIIVGTEIKFLVPFGDHFLRGFVDLIEIKADAKGQPTVRVIDFKSSSRKPTLNELKFDPQFTTYCYASEQPEFWMGNPEFDVPGIPNGEQLWEDYQKYPRRPIWYHLWGNQELDAGKRNEYDYQRLYRLACAIDEAVEKDVYVPNISADSCNFCDYAEHCNVMIPVLDRLNTDIDEEDGFF